MTDREQMIEDKVAELAVLSRSLLEATDDGLHDILSVSEWDALRSLAAKYESERSDRWLTVAEEELRPIVERAGVDEAAQAAAALDALARYREAVGE